MEKNIYTRTKISVKVLDIVIFAGIFAIVLVTVYLSLSGGFYIEFDTGGGSAVESQRLRYGEALSEPKTPTREGYSFTGWYADENLTQKVDVSSLVASESTTIYASWEYVGE